MSSAIDDLHAAVFGFRPDKEGTAYERLAAVVLAVLGWQNVLHDSTESGEGRLAEHQLDVTARHPSGEIARLLVECKDWNATVGKGTIDTLVGVRAQVGADAAAVVTIKGYKAGAIAVAVDEDIALLRLRAFDPENPTAYVKTITLKVDPVGSVYSDWSVEVMPDAGIAGGRFEFHLSGRDHLTRTDGAPAETLAEVIEAQGTSMQEGTYPRRAEFPDGRVLVASTGARVPIIALLWTERVVKSEGRPTVIERPGEPALVLEQLNEKGELQHGQVVVDRDLFAWDIDDDGKVTQRGPLGGE
jgi:hypothetical protein